MGVGGDSPPASSHGVSVYNLFLSQNNPSSKTKTPRGWGEQREELFVASNYTTNYQLNQWEAADQVLRTDFNQDNQKIDAALAGLAAKNTELEGAVAAAVAGAGNCQMELFTYTGTGAYGTENPTRVQFSHLPEFFLIGGGRALMMGRGEIGRAHV